MASEGLKSALEALKGAIDKVEVLMMESEKESPEDEGTSYVEDEDEDDLPTRLPGAPKKSRMFK